jgi:hypothetical protein
MQDPEKVRVFMHRIHEPIRRASSCLGVPMIGYVPTCQFIRATSGLTHFFFPCSLSTVIPPGATLKFEVELFKVDG